MAVKINDKDNSICKPIRVFSFHLPLSLPVLGNVMLAGLFDSKYLAKQNLARNKIFLTLFEEILFSGHCVAGFDTLDSKLMASQTNLNPIWSDLNKSPWWSNEITEHDMMLAGVSQVFGSFVIAYLSHATLKTK